MNHHWRLVLLMLAVAPVVQHRTMAADNPPPAPDPEWACSADPDHWRPGYWDFGPEGSWSSRYVVCPMAHFSGREASGNRDGRDQRPKRERLPAIGGPSASGELL